MEADRNRDGVIQYEEFVPVVIKMLNRHCGTQVVQSRFGSEDAAGQNQSCAMGSKVWE